MTIFQGDAKWPKVSPIDGNGRISNYIGYVIFCLSCVHRRRASTFTGGFLLITSIVYLCIWLLRYVLRFGWLSVRYSVLGKPCHLPERRRARRSERRPGMVPFRVTPSPLRSATLRLFVCTYVCLCVLSVCVSDRRWQHSVLPGHCQRCSLRGETAFLPDCWAASVSDHPAWRPGWGWRQGAYQAASVSKVRFTRCGLGTVGIVSVT